ncbi:MAG: iron ABC transporter ATP-binding protein [Rhodoglobus sp.]
MDVMRPHRSAILAVPLVIVALATLSGCVPDGAGTPKPTVSSSASTTPTPSATATSTPTPSATPTVGTDTPLSIGCDALVTGEQLYDFNPNFAPKPDYAPAAGSPAAEAVSRGGVACAWVNLSSGETIEIAAAQPAPERVTALANELVTAGNSVPTFGVEGYFSVANGVGVANAFPAPFWVTASAATFLEPGDAEPLMSVAISNLG